MGNRCNVAESVTGTKSEKKCYEYNINTEKNETQNAEITSKIVQSFLLYNVKFSKITDTNALIQIFLMAILSSNCETHFLFENIINTKLKKKFGVTQRRTL